MHTHKYICMYIYIYIYYSRELLCLPAVEVAAISPRVSLEMVLAIGRHDELAELLLGGNEVVNIRKHPAFCSACHYFEEAHQIRQVSGCATTHLCGCALHVVSSSQGRQKE